MKNLNYLLSACCIALIFGSCVSEPPVGKKGNVASDTSINVPFKDPVDLYGILFSEVQFGGIFEDDLVFAQAKPLKTPSEINKAYAFGKNEEGFDLATFIAENFELNSESVTQKDYPDVSGFFDRDLILSPEVAAANYLLTMENAHFLNGGPGMETGYEDAYWIMLGLEKMGRIEDIRSMMDNFAAWINTLGYIPAGNRAYQQSRSQPPVFALMVELLAKYDGPAAFRKYFKVLEKEYDFWMRGETQAYNRNEPVEHVVLIKEDDTVLNRYWDDRDMPRSEAYAADIALAKSGNLINSLVYRNLRAASESGWDLSSRWKAASEDWYMAQTTHILSVDLNSLLYQTEATLLKMYRQLKNDPKAYDMEVRMERRKQAMFKYCWNEEKGYFFDYDFVEGKQSENLNLAGVYPLFVNMATPQRAFAVAEVLEKELLKAGGLVVSTENSGKVYDAPNGLPGLHWVAINGLENFGKPELADEIRQKWMNTVRLGQKETGQFYGFYDVIHQKPGTVVPKYGFGRQKLASFAPTAAILLALGE